MWLDEWEFFIQWWTIPGHTAQSSSHSSGSWLFVSLSCTNDVCGTSPLTTYVIQFQPNNRSNFQRQSQRQKMNPNARKKTQQPREGQRSYWSPCGARICKLGLYWPTQTLYKHPLLEELLWQLTEKVLRDNWCVSVQFGLIYAELVPRLPLFPIFLQVLQQGPTFKERLGQKSMLKSLNNWMAGRGEVVAKVELRTAGCASCAVPILLFNPLNAGDLTYSWQDAQGSCTDLLDY